MTKCINIGGYVFWGDRASMLDHRCRPNAVVTFTGTEAVVRSIGGRAGSGKEVTQNLNVIQLSLP